MAEVEDFLESGETVLWLGQRAGYPRSIIWIVAHVLLAAVLFCAWSLVVSVSTDGLGFGPQVVSRADSFGLLGYTVTKRVAGGRLPAPVTSSHTFPSPLFPIPLILAIEFTRTALWRRRRYAITNRRVFSFTRTLSWSYLHTAIGAPEIRGARVRFQVSSNARRSLDGLESPQAAYAALVLAAARPPGQP